MIILATIGAVVVGGLIFLGAVSVIKFITKKEKV